MTFLYPEFLYYMLPPIFILFGFLLMKKEVEATFFSAEVMQKLKVSKNTLSLRIRNVLFLIMSTLLVVALANPVKKDGKVEIKAKSSDIMIALDISDSMLAEDVYPNRLKLAKQKALKFLSLAPNERIGIIAFAKNSYLVSPLSFDHSAVKFLLSKLNTDSITEQGTNFLSMLEVVHKSIKKDSKKYLLIFSDGGDKDNFSQEIKFAKDNKIVVYVLGVGTKKGAPIKNKDGTFIKQDGNIIVSKLNDKVSKLATDTSGVYIKSVNSDEDVKAMLKEIETNSEKKELKSQEINRYISLFYYPLGVSIFILLIATSSMPKRQRVNVVSAFLLFVFIFSNQNLEAGILDFQDLKEAKKAYTEKNYVKSAKIYNKYVNTNKKTEANYNVGNSLYKQGKYKEAIKSYEKANFTDKNKIANSLANIGNSYAKEPTKKNLQEAIKSYESSLKLREDKDTRENLEAVKKALKKQKNKKNKKDKNNKKSKQNKKDKKNSKDKKDKSSEKDKKNKKSEKDKKNKSKKEKNKQKEKNKKNKSEDNKKDKKKEKQKNKQDAQESKKSKKEQKKSKPKDMKNKMSDEEEKKWLRHLNKKQSTFMYRLNTNNQKKESTNEKPW